MLAPICLFTYNRLWETQQTVESLQNNFLAQESDLIIFSDGPKNEAAADKVDAVRKYIHQVNGFKTVKINESKENKGLANAVISGVSQVLEEYGKIIVLEDDLVTQPNFLDFMNQALDFYRDSSQVRSVNGYSLQLQYATNPVYFMQRSFPWGWGTWKNKWKTDAFDKQKIKEQIGNNKNILKDFKRTCGDDISKMLLESVNNINNSWYVRWVFLHYTTNTFSVYPRQSFVENIGYSENGTHCKSINSYHSEKINHIGRSFKFKPFEHPDLRVKREFLHYFTVLSKLMVRVKLMQSTEGREKVFEELKNKLKLG